MVVPIATPVVLGRYELTGNLASIAALAAAGQVAILPHELIRTTDGRVYHWTGTALEITSAPVHHGTVADVAALDGIYLLPSCTRGVHAGDTAYVTAAACEYRVTAGVNALAVWASCASIPTSASAIGADPSGTAATAVSTHNTAPDAHADIRTALAGKQDAGSYLTTTGTAADSAKLGGQLPSYYSAVGHTHNYAGSATPGGAATSALACTGNASMATKLATARAINGALFDGSADITISRLNDTSFKRITCPSGAVLTNYTPAIGALCVRLPKGYSDTNVRFKLRVCSFLAGKSFDVTIAGYPWSGLNWLVPTAYITGNPQQDLNLPVRFGYDSATNRVEVYVGDLTQSWPETNAYVTEVQCGYKALDSGWVQGWDIFFESSAFRNVTATVTDCQVGYRPVNAFTGAKVIGGTTCNFVNGLLVS